MKLIPIIMQLRKHCPELREHVGGLAQWRGLDDLKHIAEKQLPVAWVIPAVDAASAPMSANSTRQDVTEGFSVIVATSVSDSPRGELAIDELQTLRASLFKALLGLRPEPGMSAIYYISGGDILIKNSALLVTRYVFGSVRQLDTGLPRSEQLTAQDVELANLPALERIYADVSLGEDSPAAKFIVDFSKLQGG